MTNTFTPHKPEEMIVVKISKREAAVIQKIRRHAFGQVIVHKANGLIVRAEVNVSEMIDSDAPIDLDME